MYSTRTNDSLINNRGVRLHRRRWLPAEPPRAVLVLIHGFAEHSGRYEDHAKYFTAVGVAVETFDLAGHGLSGGRRGYVDDYRDLVEDTDAFVGEILGEYPDVPRFLLGHSLGGAVAAMVAADRGKNLSGLITSSPAIALIEPAWLQKTALVLSRVVPGLAVKAINRKYLSNDARVTSAYGADPLTFHGSVAVRTAAEIIRIGAEALLAAHRLTLPLLVIHGADDRITSPHASAEFYRNVASEDKTFSLFTGMYHETFNEPDGHRVLDAMSEFIQSRW